MSRRRDTDFDPVFTMIQIVCRYDESRHLGKVVRQRGRDMLEVGLERLDGPKGETVVRVVCPACRAKGHNHDIQLRWDRLVLILEEMTAAGEYKRKFAA